jgi:hypothetical protein
MFLSSASKAKADRRNWPRQSCSLEAMVLPGHLPCTVVDQSKGGLRLRFQRPYDGPASLTVILSASGLAYTATRRWIDGAEVGALVTAQCDLKGLVPGAFAAARQAWLRSRGFDRPYSHSHGANEP